MAAQTYYSPFIPAFSSNGAPVPGALLNFYLTGTFTRTPVYTDNTLTTELPNPVPADSSGAYPIIYLDDTITYRIIQTDSEGVQLGDQIDPYIPGTALKGDPGSPGEGYSTKAAMAAATWTDLDDTYLTEPGIEGKFVATTNDISANVTSDPLELKYVAFASDTTGASGGLVRQHDDNVINAGWAKLDGDGTDNTAQLQAAGDIALAEDMSLFIPAGIHGVSGTAGGIALDYSGLKHVYGAGQNVTTIKLVNLNGFLQVRPFVWNGVAQEFLEISDISFDGQKDELPEVAEQRNNIFLRDVKNVWVHHTSHENSNGDGINIGLSSKVITNITQANPGNVTAENHRYSTGQTVRLYGIVGMTELNGAVVTVTVVDENNFTIGVDTTAFTPYVSDGKSALSDYATSLVRIHDNSFGVCGRNGLTLGGENGFSDIWIQRNYFSSGVDTQHVDVEPGDGVGFQNVYVLNNVFEPLSDDPDSYAMTIIGIVTDILQNVTIADNNINAPVLFRRCNNVVMANNPIIQSNNSDHGVITIDYDVQKLTITHNNIESEGGNPAILAREISGEFPVNINISHNNILSDGQCVFAQDVDELKIRNNDIESTQTSDYIMQFHAQSRDMMGLNLSENTITTAYAVADNAVYLQYTGAFRFIETCLVGNRFSGANVTNCFYHPSTTISPFSDFAVCSLNRLQAGSELFRGTGGNHPNTLLVAGSNDNSGHWSVLDTPEGALTAEVGALATQRNGGAGTTFYVKETGAGNTGWTAK